MKVMIFLVFIFGVWKVYNYSGEVALGPGVMAPEEPRQKTIRFPQTFSMNGYTITEIAEFDIEAKVLSKKNYSFDQEADLSPVDLALGWGKMSDESILATIDISQSGRFYRWRVEQFPIPRREIERGSANMHLIPSDSDVERTIGRIRKGDIVKISGSLVRAVSDSGDWRWKSSLTRNDTGNGACELIWVKSIYIVTPSA